MHTYSGSSAYINGMAKPGASLHIFETASITANGYTIMTTWVPSWNPGWSS